TLYLPARKKFRHLPRRRSLAWNLVTTPSRTHAAAKPAASVGVVPFAWSRAKYSSMALRPTSSLRTIISQRSTADCGDGTAVPSGRGVTTHDLGRNGGAARTHDAPRRAARR